MPPPADADAELEREQGAEATTLWAVGDFDAAHQTLQRLDATLPGDARVQLNLWVAGYHADASSSLDSVAKELEAWLKTHPAGPVGEVSDFNTHAVAAVNYGLILFLQQQHASALSVLEPLFEAVDILQDGTALCLCVLLLEVYLDSCQLHKAVRLLQYLQGLCAAAHPTSLLADDGAAAAAAGAPAAAAAGDAGSSSSSSQGHAGAARAKSPSKQQQDSRTAQEGSAGAAPTAADVQAGQQQQQQQREDGAVVPLSQAAPAVSKTKGHRMQEVFQLVQQQGGKPPGQDLAPLLHLYKARLALACDNHKAAKKEVRGLQSAEPDSSAALLLKAQLEACRQQPRKALKTLGPLLTGQQQHTARCRLQLLNLLAALHHQLDKHHVAALYLTTALNLNAEVQQQQQPSAPPGSKADSQQQRKQQGKRQQKKQQQQQQQGKAAAGSEQASADAAPAEGSATAPAAAAAAAPTAAPAVPRQSHCLLADMSDALSYNLGLQQLSLQDWQGAMASFEAASGKYFTRPQLWLRWAEACLGLFHQQQAEQQQQQQQLAAQQGGAGAPSAPGGGKGKGGGKQGKGQASKKKQQQQGISCEQLLQQAAAHLNTGLTLLQEQQAAAAKQLEAATAAAAAAAAVGQPLPELAGHAWPVQEPLAGAGSSGQGSAGASSSSSALAAAAAASSSAAAAAAADSAAPALPCDPALLPPELSAVRQALLSNKAYVALQLAQPDEALQAGRELVACSSLSPQQHYLGTSYAAEALCLLGRVDEAKLQLDAHVQLFMRQQQQQGVGGGDSIGAAAAPGQVQDSRGAVGVMPAVDAAPAAAGSTKSFDGSCVSCSKGVCGQGGGLGVSGAGAALTLQDQAALLHNTGAVLMLQGDAQEAFRHAVLAAAVAGGQQEGVVLQLQGP